MSSFKNKSETKDTSRNFLALWILYVRKVRWGQLRTRTNEETKNTVMVSLLKYLFNSKCYMTEMCAGKEWPLWVPYTVKPVHWKCTDSEIYLDTDEGSIVGSASNSRAQYSNWIWNIFRISNIAENPEMKTMWPMSCVFDIWIPLARISTVAHQRISEISNMAVPWVNII